MLQHLLVVGAALFIGLWSTVVQQYHEFKTPTGTTPSEQAAPDNSLGGTASADVPLAQPTTPTPFEIVVSHIVAPGTTTATSSQPVPTVPLGPVAPTTPSVPFRPLPVPTSPLPTPKTASSTDTSPSPTFEQKLSDEALLKGAIVNIVCLPNGDLRGSSGSGVIIDSRGIVATVAHIGQRFLLRNYPTKNSGSCYIRTGSPAKNAYSAELIYISPTWVKENKATFLETKPRGTGEHDFAFLAITGTISQTPLPSHFISIPFAPVSTDIKVGDHVGTASYAAEFISSSEVRSSLYPTIKFADINDVFTFDERGVDIFDVAAGSAAQAGSSGGVVINEDGRLIGIISTRDISGGLSLRTLQAITPDHMRDSFLHDVGENLDAYLRDSIPTLIRKFEDTAVELQDILFETLMEADT